MSHRARFAVPAMLAAMLTLPAFAPARADRSNARSGSIVRARTALSQFDAGLLGGRGDPVTARPQSSPGAPRFGFAQPFGFGSALVGSAPVGQGPSTLALNPATHTIYVANGYNDNGLQLPVPGNTVSVIDTRHCQARDISSCKGPWPTITVGSMPSGIAIDKNTDTVYVSNVGDNTVSVFNGATCNAEDTSGCTQTPAVVPVGLDPLGILADPANHTVYVPDTGANAVGGPQNSTAVSMLDSATCNATDLAACPTTPPPTVDVGASPTDVSVDQVTHTVYVTTFSNGNPGSNNGWTVFDANTCNATLQSGCATIGTLPGDPSGPNAAQIDPANHTLYTANYDNTISAFDLNVCDARDLAGCASDTPGTVTPFPDPGFGDHDLWVAVDARLHTVYAAYQKDDALLIVNTNVCNGAHLARCATLDPPEIHTGSDPESVALDPQTQTLYTANVVSNNVSAIDPARCDAQTSSGCRARVPEVPMAAGGLTADPAVDTTYVASGANTVSMIDASTCNAYRSAGCSAVPPTVTVGPNPRAVAINPATHTVYIANAGTGTTTGTINVFDDRTCNATHQVGCTTVSTLDVPDGIPVGLAVNPRTDTIYVATITSNGGPNLISVFDGSTCNATTATGCSQTPANAPTGADDPVDGSTESVAVNAATNTIYATSETLGSPFLGHTVYVINGPTCDAADMAGCPNPPATISVGSDPVFGDANPFGIAVDEATDTIYTANIFDGEGPGTVSVINGATCDSHNTSGCDQTPAPAPAGFGANGIAVDPTTNNIYATNDEDTSVTTINGNSCKSSNQTGCADTRTRAIVGDYPGVISVDPAVDTAYVADIEGVSVMPLTP
jgi:DNA-binding beta-propeller fold protein YncE